MEQELRLFLLSSLRSKRLVFGGCPEGLRRTRGRKCPTNIRPCRCARPGRPLGRMMGTSGNLWPLSPDASGWNREGLPLLRQRLPGQGPSQQQL